MKLVIEIPDHIYEHAKNCSEDSYDEWDAMRAIAKGFSYEQRPHGAWIQCSERLPEETLMVLVNCDDFYLKRLNPCIGWRNGQYWHTFTAKGLTRILYPIAWLPLPEPYKKESEKK